jgi:hypothetical protein
MTMRHVYIVFDESASMAEYTRPVREALRELEKTYELHFIGFSCSVYHGRKVDEVPAQKGSTNIWMAFRTLSALLSTAGSGDAATVVFVSDGHDSNPQVCMQQLARLPDPPCQCTLFCIGVGPHFPTTLVLEQLRPRFHTVGDDTLPSVIPLCSPEETAQVFVEMETLVFERPAPVERFDEHTSLQDLMKGSEQTYNTAVNRCARESSRERGLAIVDEGVATLERIQGLAERLRKSTLEVDGLTDFLPLASNLLQAGMFNTARCLGKVKNMLAQLGLVRQRIEVKGLMLASCTDAEKQKVLSYGHVVGRHLKAAHAYHSANYAASRQTLKAFLEKYEPNPHDEALEDKISMCSQATFLLDAKQSLKQLLPQIPTLVHLIQFVPLVCRTLTLTMPLPDGLQMNPWLAHVEGMPTILTHVTTYDFFERYKNGMPKRGEVVNGIMLVTHDPEGSLLARGIGRHLASYLLTRNSDLYFPDADLATWGMAAAFLLRQPVLKEWMLKEIRQLVAMCKAVYPDGSPYWGDYVQEVASDGFRRALPTSSAQLPKHCQCPHLNKFLLACLVAGDRLTLPQLEERRDAAIVEFFARRGAKMTELFECRYQDQDTGPLVIEPTLEETRQGFLQSIRKWQLVRTLHLDDCKHLGHWNLSASKIEQSFGNLARLQGMELPAVADLSPLLFTGLKFKDDSAARCKGERATMGDVDVDKELRAHLRLAAPAHVHRIFLAASLKLHSLPVLMSEANMAAFQAKHGRDLKRELDVTPWGLSRVACLSPHCPFFGRALGRPALSRDGKPRMADRLVQHLEGLPGEKGFHRDGLAPPEDTPFELFERLFLL